MIPESPLDHTAIDWFMTEVTVGYTVSVESSFDPSHAQFLHKGIAGFSPERAIPMEHFEVLEEITGDAGFCLKHSGYNIFNKDMNATRKFTPPCANTTIYEYSNGKLALFQLYFVPTKPGYCKQIGKFVFSSPENPKFSWQMLPKLLPNLLSNFWLKLLPEYLQIGLKHSFNDKLSNQDIAMMHSQTVNEFRGGNQSWQKSYFMPSLADVGIVTFRKWLDEFGGGQPEWQGVQVTSFPELTEQELYDRWHRHTKHCPNCRQSLFLLDKLKKYCQILLLLLTIINLGLIIFHLPLNMVLIPVLIGILILFFFYKLDSFHHRFLSYIPKSGLPIVKLD